MEKPYTAKDLMVSLTGRNNIHERDTTSVQTLWVTLQEVGALDSKDFDKSAFQKQLTQIGNMTTNIDVISEAACELKGEPHGELATALDNDDLSFIQRYYAQVVHKHTEPEID